MIERYLSEMHLIAKWTYSAVRRDIGSIKIGDANKSSEENAF